MGLVAYGGRPRLGWDALRKLGPVVLINDWYHFTRRRTC